MCSRITFTSTNLSTEVLPALHAANRAYTCSLHTTPKPASYPGPQQISSFGARPDKFGDCAVWAVYIGTVALWTSGRAAVVCKVWPAMLLLLFNRQHALSCPMHGSTHDSTPTLRTIIKCFARDVREEMAIHCGEEYSNEYIGKIKDGEWSASVEYMSDHSRYTLGTTCWVGMCQRRALRSGARSRRLIPQPEMAPNTPATTPRTPRDAH